MRVLLLLSGMFVLSIQVTPARAQADFVEWRCLQSPRSVCRLHFVGDSHRLRKLLVYGEHSSEVARVEQTVFLGKPTYKVWMTQGSRTYPQLEHVSSMDEGIKLVIKNVQEKVGQIEVR